MKPDNLSVRVIWTGTFWDIGSADPDQIPQNAASDQGLHCLIELQEVKG